MPNRLCNLDPNAKIKDDYSKITTGFDRTAAELDSHQAQITAEQQARINQVQAHISAIAAHAAAAITLSPVTGLTATTVQTGVEQLRTMLTTIIAGPAPSTAEIQAARVGADNIARASLDILIKEIHAKLIAANNQTTTLKHGLNVVTADEAGPVAVMLKGNTLINLLGKDGNFETASAVNAWSTSSAIRAADTTTFSQGAQSMLVTATDATWFNVERRVQNFIQRGTNKYYLIRADVKNIDTPSVGITWRFKDLAQGGTVDSAKIGTVVPSVSGFSFAFVKVSPADYSAVENPNYCHIRFESTATASGQKFYVDGVAIYEVDAATYAKIGADPDYTGDKLAERYPYVDGIQHVRNPVITKSGKNLLPPFTDWARHSNFTVSDAYDMTLTPTADNQESSIVVPAVSGQSYKFSYVSGRYHLYIRDKAGNTLFLQYFATSSTVITAPANSDNIRLLATNASGLGTTPVRFLNPQLELGSTVTQFEPRNDDYLYAPVTLAGYGGVQDVLAMRGTEASVLRRWKTDLLLDGSLGWIYYLDYSGYKRFGVTLATGVTVDYASFYDQRFVVTKPDGTSLTNNPGFTAADSAVLQTNTVGGLKITVADLDTGFGEVYNPTGQEVAAFFYGWKMNNGTFGTPYNGTGTKTWARWDATNNTGAVTTVPTTLASGFTPYRVTYLLPSPVTEVVQVEGSLANHPGANMYEVSEGVIVREKATPTLFAAYNVYVVNNSSVPASWTKNKLSTILAINRNGIKDNRWKVLSQPTGANGKQYLEIPVGDFDSTAEYPVTYLALDKYAMTSPLVDASMEYATSSKMVQDLLVQRMADVETVSTINVNAIAELYRRMKALGG